MANAPLIPFIPPIVPQLPGVPALLSQVSAVIQQPLAAVGLIQQDIQQLLNPVSLVQQDFSQIFAGSGSQRQWGIFTTGGSPLLPADGVFSVEYAQEFRISDYPQEQGAFFSYNKVQMPFMAKVTFLLKADRIAFLQGIFPKMYALDLVTVITPEMSYPSANIIHFGYRRTAKDGVSLILAEVWVQEVRVTGVQSATSQAGTNAGTTASPNGQTPSPGGNVTPQPTTSNPTNPITGNMVSGLPNPPGQLPSNALPSPNIPSAFYNDNIPAVPNELSNLGGPQQAALLAQPGQIQMGNMTGNVFDFPSSATVLPSPQISPPWPVNTQEGEEGVEIPIAPATPLAPNPPPTGSVATKYNTPENIISP